MVEITLLLCAAASFYFTRADPNLAARLAAMWLVFTPYYLEQFMGQFSLIQAALIFGMLLLVSRETGYGAGATGPISRFSGHFDAIWIASLIWKINTIVFVPVYVRLRRWRGLVAAGLLTALV